jgi:hypothetical protein
LTKVDVFAKKNKNQGGALYGKTGLGNLGYYFFHDVFGCGTKFH